LWLRVVREEEQRMTQKAEVVVEQAVLELAQDFL
jgi:hypothetical protein